MAIAALMILIVVLVMLSSRTRESVRAHLTVSTQREVLIRRLATRFGGDRFAEQTARAVATAASKEGIE
jgi:hypothetical protein